MAETAKKDPPVWLTSAVVAALISAGVGYWSAHSVAKDTIAAQRETTHDQVSAQLVAVAAGVLTSQGKVDPDARVWARNVINTYSPVKLGPNTTLPAFPWGVCTPDGPAAIVSPTGLVVGCHPGTTTVTIRAGDQTSSAKVTVGSPKDSTHAR